MKYWAIGDIHGCLNTLKNIVKKIEEREYEKLSFDVPAEDVKFIFVGDLIDRGPFSREVVEFVRNLVESERAICLRGNHEQMAIDAVNSSQDELLWIRNGGDACLQSYENNLDKLKVDIEWFDSLPYYITIKNYYICHAGVNPEVELDNQFLYDLIWIRNEFLVSTKEFGKKIVFGHTPLKDVMNHPNKIGIDTGCVYNNKLTAFCLNDKDVIQVEKHWKDGVFK